MADPSAQASKTLDDLLNQYRRTDKEMQNFSRTIGKMSESLSNAGVDKFEKNLRAAAKSSGIFNDEQLDSIKGLRRFQEATDAAEKSLDGVKTARKQLANDIRKARQLQGKDRVKEITLAHDAYDANLANLKLSRQQADHLKQTVPAYRQQASVLADSVAKHDVVNKKLEAFGGSIKNRISEFAKFGTAVSLLSKAVMGTYEQMSRLTQRGMLGAFTAINRLAPMLLLLPKDLEEIINKNRDLIASFGGGVEGIEKLTEEISVARDGLEYLGAESSKAAARFIEVNKSLGLTRKDGEAYRKTMNAMKKQFTEFSSLFGDSYDDYAKLIESQAEELTQRTRLNGLLPQQIAMQTQELMKRTENLKLMGLSNQQIVEFNKKIEDLYNPNKNSQLQRRREAASGSQGNRQTLGLLQQTGNTAEASALQQSMPTLDTMANLHATGQSDKLKALMASPEGQAALMALSQGNSALSRAQQNGSLSDVQQFGRNALNDQGGGYSDLLKTTGEQLSTANRQNRNLAGNPDLASIRANSISGAGLQNDPTSSTTYAATNLTKAFEAATIAAQSWANLMTNPLSQAVIGTVALLLSMRSALAIFRSSVGGAGVGAGASRLGMAARGGLAGIAGIATHELLSAADPNDNMGSWIDKNVPGASWLDHQASKIGLGRSYAEQAGGASASASQQPLSVGSNMSNVKGWDKASSSSKSAIMQAAAASGVNPQLLAAMAGRESGFDPNAQASTSSAGGLFQFIDSTWIETIKKYGSKYGINASSMSNQQLLALKKDPQINAYMGAEYMKQNQLVTGDSSAGGTYLAHFLGAQGAKNVLSANANTPISQLVTPNQIASNASIFANVKTAGDMQQWASGLMGDVGTSSAAGGTTSNPLLAEQQKQTALLARIAAQGGSKIVPKAVTKPDVATVANAQS